MIEAKSSGVLNRKELARVCIVLHITVGFNEQLVPCHKSATPPSHIEALAGGMKFDSNLLRAGCGKKAQGLALKDKSSVGRIMNDNDPVPLREIDNFGEKPRCGARTGRVVWIIDDQYF